MATIRNEILEAGVFERYSESFAGGEPANNHLSLDKIDQHSRLFGRIILGMADLIIFNNDEIEEVDFLAPIPSGGDRLAMAISRKIKKPVVHFDKVEAERGQKKFRPHNWLDVEALARYKKGVVVDDVSTALTSLAGILRVPEMADKDMQYCGIWRRGNTELEAPIDINKYWLVEEYIPRELPADSKLWKYAGEEVA